MQDGQIELVSVRQMLHTGDKRLLKGIETLPKL
jgi:hypothetical protein